MFSTPERAQADIAARRAKLESAMKRIAGSEEWGIRVLRSPSAVDSAAGGPAAPARSGIAFLAAKKQKRDQARQARAAAAEAAMQAYEQVAVLAKESRRREDPPAAGATPPLLDAAFLVPRSRRARFTNAAKRAAERCAQAGAQLSLSGPWPAYNFIEDARTR
jgi:hypothetical protein